MDIASGRFDHAHTIAAGLTDDLHQIPVEDPLGPSEVPPDDLFDLSVDDARALDALEVTFSAPNSVEPFHPSEITWSIKGSAEHEKRVELLWLTGGNQEIQARDLIDGEIISIHRPTTYNLVGRFRSGYAVFGTATVVIDDSKCHNTSRSGLEVSLENHLRTDLPTLMPGIGFSVPMVITGASPSGLQVAVSLFVDSVVDSLGIHAKASFVLAPELRRVVLNVTGLAATNVANVNAAWTALAAEVAPDSTKPPQDVVAERVAHSLRRFGDEVVDGLRAQADALQRPIPLSVSHPALGTSVPLTSEVTIKWCESLHLDVINGTVFDGGLLAGAMNRLATHRVQ